MFKRYFDRLPFVKWPMVAHTFEMVVRSSSDHFDFALALALALAVVSETIDSSGPSEV